MNKVLGRENDFSMRELHIKLEAFVKKYSVDEGYSGRWWSEGVGSDELVEGMMVRGRKKNDMFMEEWRGGCMVWRAYW